MEILYLNELQSSVQSVHWTCCHPLKGTEIHIHKEAAEGNAKGTYFSAEWTAPVR